MSPVDPNGQKVIFYPTIVPPEVPVFVHPDGSAIEVPEQARPPSLDRYHGSVDPEEYSLSNILSKQGGEESWWITDRLGEIFDGVVYGDLSDEENLTKSLAQIGTGLTPVVGQIADARDTYAAARNIVRGKEGAWSDLGFAIVGWVPLFGDSIKAARGATKTVLRQADEIGPLLGKNPELSRHINDDGITFKKPVALDSNLPKGTVYTDEAGNRVISSAGDLDDVIRAVDADEFKKGFKPTANFLKEYRTSVKEFGYENFAALKYAEDAIAAGVAGFKSEGVFGFVKGLWLPFANRTNKIGDVANDIKDGVKIVNQTADVIYPIKEEKKPAF